MLDPATLSSLTANGHARTPCWAMHRPGRLFVAHVRRSGLFWRAALTVALGACLCPSAALRARVTCAAACLCHVGSRENRHPALARRAAQLSRALAPPT
eukprot:15247735-Alexandrium_andersonii.AAC.1